MPAPLEQGHPQRDRAASGRAVVIEDLRLPDGSAVPCPAAPLLAGELLRAGLRVEYGTAPVAGPATAATAADGVFVAAFPGAPGHVGLGVRTDPADRSGTALARAALTDLLAVTTAAPRTVLLASPRSFCAGVDRAIETVERALERHDGPVYVRKQIVHNTHVVADLGARGAVFVDELDEVPEGATVVFSAHGVSPAVHTEAERRRLEVIDATCPLVTKVHNEARRFAARGDTVVFIGHAGHEEVEGTLGEAPDHMVLVEDVSDVDKLQVEDPAKVSFLTQTTLAVDETTDIITALKSRFPELREPGSEDICYATTNRQNALRMVTQQSDLVLVVGSPNSSNSLRLVEISRREGTPAHLIEDATAIRTEWLAGVTTVGLTAGASAPPDKVDGVVAALGGLGPLIVREHELTRETVHFTLPSSVRSS
ncbi:4-hydroxy-3-methylbut-2-enyl diphosphate reductase [Sinosporangium album]|uniref:4-hydroxy-3-methylbut-2-enyl diphosphate reductase n=1 Tax=Sinosporangium album TaxID=504805 RepID=A0A1G8B7N6_9ACTN|nr:4-hydroxy-3-methylbut-2-enyl diphosphate reductase [Sinosporangium album]SDH29175.1 4-hydroxy-3-methylbut-2-enyl diphosphate reductase [Sinosporangium album]